MYFKKNTSKSVVCVFIHVGLGVNQLEVSCSANSFSGLTTSLNSSTMWPDVVTAGSAHLNNYLVFSLMYLHLEYATH